MCTRVGVLDRGRLVLQEDMSRDPRGRPGWSACRPPTSARRIALLDGRVEQHAATPRSWSEADDTADLNARLVAAGVRVTGLEPVRRTLEQVVLEATHAMSDGSMLVELSPAAAHVGDDRALDALPTLVAVLLALTDLGPRPGSGPPSCPPCSPTAPCSRSPRSASCCRCSCRWPSRWSAATRSPARRRATPCATCSCGRSPGRGC